MKKVIEPMEVMEKFGIDIKDDDMWAMYFDSETNLIIEVNEDE